MQAAAIIIPTLSAATGDKCAMKSTQARIIAIVAMVTSIWASEASGKPCSPKDADAAEALVDHLDNWESLERAHMKYGHCDEGSIAEGYSEAVARLLVDQWRTLPDLAARIDRSPAFGRFVLHHIDDTLNTDDLDKVATLATSSCPSRNMNLCHRLARAATHAERGRNER
jgi:hypothetical protein